MHERKRSIRTLAKYANLSYKDIAKVVGLKYNTVKRYLSLKSEIGPTLEHEEAVRSYVKEIKEREK